MIEENIFQHNKISSLKRGLPSILKRTNVLDDTLRTFVLEEPLEVGKVINLYAIMKTDRLFFEFMDEVVQDKLETNNYILEKKDLNAFFMAKAEQDENIANWSESTIRRLKQVYVKILVETGLLQDKNSHELRRLLIDEKVKMHISRIGDIRYIHAMGE